VTCTKGPSGRDCLRSPLDKTLDHQPVGINAPVWSNVAADGAVGSRSCNGWLDDDGDETGGAGFATATQAFWTSNPIPLACDQYAQLYCFQQTRQ
jgi:hypothetical protein